MGVTEPVRPLFGADLRIDSEDDENLQRLPEIERELILSERHEMLQRYREEKALYDKYMKRSDPSGSSNVEKSTKRSAPSRSYRSDRQSEDSDSESSSGSDSDSSYTSESSSGDEMSAVRGLTTSATEKSIASAMDASLTITAARMLQVTRDQLLSSFQDVPVDLRKEALIDLIVRVPAGNGEYLMCRVTGVQELGRRTPDSGKFDLIVDIPNTEPTAVPVSSISNTELTDTELAVWETQYGPELALELARKVGRKTAQVKAVKDFVWDDSAINRSLASRKTTSVKVTLEIAKLRTALQAELEAWNQSSSNMSEEQRAKIQDNINRINGEIAAMETQHRATQRAFQDDNAHQFGIVAINHRNRTEQRMQDIEEAKKRLKSKATKQEVGGKRELNPFKRRECNPVVMWDVGKKSPKREAAVDPTAVPMAVDEAPVTEHKVSISDVVNIEKLIADVAAAVSAPGGGRLAAVQRSMRSQYTDGISAVWATTASGGSGGETMDFAEWKRRVAQEGMDEE